MIQPISKNIIVSALILGLTACGYQQGEENRHGASTQKIGDNRQEYMIKNRTDENEYLDMNTNPHMDTRVSDEKLKTDSGTAIQSAEYDLEQSMKQKILQLRGVQDAEVNVVGQQANIRFHPTTGSNAQQLEQQIKDVIQKLYAYQVNVTSY